VTTALKTRLRSGLFAITSIARWAAISASKTGRLKVGDFLNAANATPQRS
jgi:hypothetical protein